MRTFSTLGFLLVIAILLLVAPVTAQKRIYISPDDHTDYYWVADEATYRQAFLTMIDYYLNKMDETAGNPSDQQMRWNCDGSLWMWEYERNRTPAQFARMMSRVRDGHMSVALNPLVLVQGGAPTESVLRGMYYPGLIERRHKVQFPLAIAMEDQTMPFGLASLWAGSGAKYSWKGVCDCATQVTALYNRDREIYYAGGRDGSKVLLKWHSQLNTNKKYGGYAEAFDPLASIIFAEVDPTFVLKYPYPVVGAFGRGWDDLEYTSDEFVTVAQQHTNANRRLIVSNQIDFFQDFETNYGAGLETYSASFGNEWDTLIASMTEVSARVKRSTEKLRSAEAMATLVSINQPTFMDSRIAARDRAMINLGLYFEHDWTADGPFITRAQRAAWNRSIEQQITSYVDTLYDDAKAALSSQISRSGIEERFAVFNPLSWTRTDFADIPLTSRNKQVHVVDVSTGLQVPSQIIGARSQRMLRILAGDVPSAGYRVYEIRNGAGTVSLGAPAVNGSTVENANYSVTLAPDGAITSLIDKTRGNRETVRNIGGRVLNDLGGNRSGSVTVESSGPVSVTLKAVSSSPIVHTTRVTLYKDIDRVDISNTISANFGDLKTWSYSFDINSPDVWHEEVGAVIRGKLTTNGGHYATRNARYDWLTMNHFADVTDGVTNNFGVTVSNADDHFMQLGSSTITALDTTTPQFNILAGGQTDGPSLGIPDQGGDSEFLQRFAIQTHGNFNQPTAMKFSLEHQNPLVTILINGTGTQERAYPADNYSFLQITDPNVFLWALKPAEDGIGRGIVARVWNQGNSPSNYSLSLSRPITAAERLTHIETTIAPATVSSGQLNASINQQQIQTHLLKITGSRPSNKIR
ncbi:MAG: glycoside hydrolase [Chloracidobacterium sp.]|nr:glycoside hydrolase [Chloracidobacterium sp.]